jgi:uncharacterized glyoxalase superfamily protein PhnB
MKKLTPILLVEEIEVSLPFWKRLGFEITAEVPHEDRTGFAILTSGPIEIMMQTFSSALADVPGAVSTREPGSAVLYFEVEDVAAISEKIEGAPVVVPLRKTFYGATEIFVREPGGHVVGFAQHESRSE